MGDHQKYLRRKECIFKNLLRVNKQSEYPILLLFTMNKKLRMFQPNLNHKSKTYLRRTGQENNLKANVPEESASNGR
jgi:hypothetical protein